jgi:hypothetical protein
MPVKEALCVAGFPIDHQEPWHDGDGGLVGDGYSLLANAEVMKRLHTLSMEAAQVPSWAGSRCALNGSWPARRQ